MIILIKRIISFVIFVLIGLVFYKKVIKGENIFFSRGKKQESESNSNVEKMEKDPVCGTYILEKTSLKLKSEGTMYHFCSDKCREEYISRLKK